MKNQLKIYFKIGILFFGISSLLWNCEKESLFEVHQSGVNKHLFKVKTVTLSEIPQTRDFILAKTNGNLFSKSTEIDGAIFDDENILEVIDTLNHTNYSFRFSYPDTPIGTFYNLIVGKTPQGENKTPYVLKYVCDAEHLDSFVTSNFNFESFKGTIAIHKYTDFFQVGSILKTEPNCPPNNDENGDPIPCDTDGVDGGSTGSSGGGGDGENGGYYNGGETNNGSGNGGSGSSSCSWHLEYTCSCEGELVGDHDHKPVVLVIVCPPGNVAPPQDNNTVTKSANDGCPDCPDGSDGGVGVLPTNTLSQQLVNILGIEVSENLIGIDSQTKIELLSFLAENGNSQEAISSSQMFLTVSDNNMLNGPYNTTYFNAINQFTSVDLNDPYLAAIWIQHFSAQVAIIKFNNPDWSNRRIYWEASKETIHIALDIAGLVPVVGEVFDVVNGIIYTIEGDGLNASLSIASAIPVAGWFVTGGKYAVKGIWKVVVRADGFIDFGARNSKEFRKALGLVTGDGKHAHHIIPWIHRVHGLVQHAAKDPRMFHINEVLNGIPLPSGNHLTGHTGAGGYNDIVNNVMTNMYTPGMTPTDAYNRLTGFISYLDNLISSNPTLNLGEIADLISYP